MRRLVAGRASGCIIVNFTTVVTQERPANYLLLLRLRGDRIGYSFREWGIVILFGVLRLRDNFLPLNIFRTFLIRAFITVQVGLSIRPNLRWCWLIAVDALLVVKFWHSSLLARKVKWNILAVLTWKAYIVSHLCLSSEVFNGRFRLINYSVSRNIEVRWRVLFL